MSNGIYGPASRRLLKLVRQRMAPAEAIPASGGGTGLGEDRRQPGGGLCCGVAEQLCETAPRRSAVPQVGSYLSVGAVTFAGLLGDLGAGWALLLDEDSSTSSAHAWRLAWLTFKCPPSPTSILQEMNQPRSQLS